MSTKVTIFSLKTEKGVYAYSTVKEYIKMFKMQRNMQLFNVKTIEMSKYEFMSFSNNNKSEMLCKDYLYDGKTDIEVVATVYETSSLSEACTYIYNTACSIEDSIPYYGLKDKYLNAILALTEVITQRTKSNNGALTLNVNTFKLFYHLFRKTFSEDSEMIENII